MEDSKYRLDDFDLYNKARDYRKQVYLVIKLLPAEEKYALSQQMRRAALSITHNIAEGHGRWHFQENIQFCRIARGSTEETIDQLNVCIDECYGSELDLEQLKSEAYNLIKSINSYIYYLNSKKRQQSPVTTH